MFDLTLWKLVAIMVGSLIVGSVLVVYVFLPLGAWLHRVLFTSPLAGPKIDVEWGVAQVQAFQESCQTVVNHPRVPYGCVPPPKPDTESQPLLNRIALLEEVVYDRHVTVSLDDLVVLKNAPTLLRELSYTLHNFQPDDRTPAIQEKLIRYALALERLQSALGVRVK